MHRYTLILLLSILLAHLAPAQEIPDSSGVTVSVQVPQAPVRPEPPHTAVADSLLARSAGNPLDQAANTARFAGVLLRQVYRQSIWYPFTAPADTAPGKRIVHGKETMFYFMIFLVFLFALLKAAFSKYLSDIFRLFFRRTLKQRQISEQLLQSPLPSLLFNIFFVVTGGIYCSFLLGYYVDAPVENFWLLALYCAAGLSLIYLVKYLGLKITGWIFGIPAATDAYIFIVFMFNKIMGIFLLPFTVALGLVGGRTADVLVVLSYWGLAVLFLYRFVMAYRMLHNQIKINPFHFFLYLCAFEIAPLLLIYKLLMPLF